MDLIWEGIAQAVHRLVSGDGDIWRIALRSLLISGSATLIALAIGVGIGYFLAFRRFPGRDFVVALVNTGMGLPPVVVGLFVAIILWRSGPLGQLSLIYTPAAIVIAQTVIATPMVTGFTVAALSTLPSRLKLQLYALGASPPQALWLLLREARLPLLAALMAGFGAAISEIGASQMVGGNLDGETRVLTTAVVLDVQRGDFSSAIALSIILLAMIFLVNLVLTGVQQRGRRMP